MPREVPVHGDAYVAVRHIYDKSPGKSWRRLNGALQSALSSAIEAHLSFLPDDFRAICHDTNGGYWMGGGEGSTTGERYYGLAVKVGHTPACISFESFAKRPAAPWSENVKTPVRLCIGSEFTWQGQKLTVTSMRGDHLVACTYKGCRYSNDDRLEIGSFEHLGDRKYRQIEGFYLKESGAIEVSLGAPVEDPYSRKVDRVVKITYDDLYIARQRHGHRRREALKAIAAAETEQALVEVMTGIASNPAGTYRHFDIEDIRKAGQERKRTFDEADARKLRGQEQEEIRQRRQASYASDLEDWVNGAPARQWFHDVRIRVAGAYVETSTGQRASVEAARRALPIVLRRRKSNGPVRNLMVDSYPVVEQSADGVKVGCTLIPWTEVERLPALLSLEATDAA